MRKLVMKTLLFENEMIEVIQQLYRVFFTSQYILTKLVSIGNFDDLKFIKRGLTKISGRIEHFSSSKSTQ